MTRLDTLPVELLYEIQLYALSPDFPILSSHFHRVFRAATPSFSSRYLLGKALDLLPQPSPKLVYTSILRYPLCSQAVLEAFSRLYKPLIPKLDGPVDLPELPRRLFRHLKRDRPWGEYDAPLPFLKFLYNGSGICVPPAVNSHGGYALAKAVHAKFTPLVQFLLRQGASPSIKNSLSVMIAIQHNDLALTRMLIEREDEYGSAAGGFKKRRRLADRLEVNGDMLKEAVKVDARDIVDYLVNEKGCVPDLATVKLIRRTDSPRRRNKRRR